MMLGVVHKSITIKGTGIFWKILVYPISRERAKMDPKMRFSMFFLKNDHQFLLGINPNDNDNVDDDIDVLFSRHV